MNHCKTCEAFCRENAQLRAKLRELDARVDGLEAENARLHDSLRDLEAIAAGAVVNAAERAVDVMELQQHFNEGQKPYLGIPERRDFQRSTRSMESTPRPGLTRRQFFAALLAPFLVRFARWFRPAPASTTLTAAAPSSPTTITCSSAGDTLRVGDRYTISGYYMVNPQTLEPTAILRSFEVTDVVRSRREITFRPAAITDGQYKTVHKAA